MSAYGRNLAIVLTRELDAFVRELDLWPDDERVWQSAPGVTNSAANLALHVAGNLQHFVGAVLGGTGYVRDRADEFGRRGGRRQDVIDALGAARDVVERVLPGLSEDRLSTAFPETVNDIRMPADRFLLHLAVHAAYHLGQASYLRRLLLGDSRTASALSLQPLAE